MRAFSAHLLPAPHISELYIWPNMLCTAYSSNWGSKTELKSAQQHAKEAKTVADAAGKKIQRVEKAMEDERQARTEAEKAAADLRVEAATLIERAAHAEELRGLVQELRGQMVLKTEAKTGERRSAPAKRGKTK